MMGPLAPAHFNLQPLEVSVHVYHNFPPTPLRTIMYVNSSPSFLGHVSLLHWLLSHGATADTDDLEGTSLHDIAEHGQMEVRSI